MLLEKGKLLMPPMSTTNRAQRQKYKLRFEISIIIGCTVYPPFIRRCIFLAHHFRLSWCLSFSLSFHPVPLCFHVVLVTQSSSRSVTSFFNCAVILSPLAQSHTCHPLNVFATFCHPACLVIQSSMFIHSFAFCLSIPRCANHSYIQLLLYLKYLISSSHLYI